MHNLTKISSLVALALAPFVAFGAAPTFARLVDQVIGIINLLVPILAGVAIIVFFWGIFRYIGTAGDSEAHSKGRQLIIWGIIALFVLFGLRGILAILQSTFLK